MRATLLAAALMLCACRDQRPPAPTQEESTQLNDAENMLNDLSANETGNAD